MTLQVDIIYMVFEIGLMYKLKTFGAKKFGLHRLDAKYLGRKIMKLNAILSTCVLGVSLVSTGCGASMYDTTEKSTNTKLANNVSRSVRNSVNGTTDYYTDTDYRSNGNAYTTDTLTRNNDTRYGYDKTATGKSYGTGRSNLEQNDYNNVIGNRDNDLSRNGTAYDSDVNIDGNAYGVRDQNMYNYKVQRDASINDFEAYTTDSDVGYYNNRALDNDNTISKQITANSGAVTRGTVGNTKGSYSLAMASPKASMAPRLSTNATGVTGRDATRSSASAMTASPRTSAVVTTPAMGATTSPAARATTSPTTSVTTSPATGSTRNTATGTTTGNAATMGNTATTGNTNGQSVQSPRRQQAVAGKMTKTANRGVNASARPSVQTSASPSASTSAMPKAAI